MLRLGLGVLAAAGLFACDRTEASDTLCTVGEEEPCACGDGSGGTRVCLGDGLATPCACGAERIDPCGAPGVRHPCSCDDGAPGTRVCLADGSMTACRCEAAQPAPTPAPGTVTPMDGPVAVEAPPTPVVLRCCADGGSCLPAELIPDAERALLRRDACERGQRCVPDVVQDPEGFALQPCRSLGEIEGRCVPECMAIVEGTEDVLPRDLCPKRQLCVPCFDPLTGEPTGVCGLSQDPGPIEPPLLFGRCCDDRGACTPASLVPPEAEGQLAVAECDGARGLVCVPEPLGDPQGFTLESCRAPPDLEGRCVPACLPVIADRADALSQAACDTGLLCTPCFDPFTGAATGVCGLGNDPGAAEPPVVFAGCCEVDGTTRGTCLPAALLPPEAADALGPETCPDAGDLCTPGSLIDDPTAGLRACTGLLGTAGGCVPACLLDPVPPLLIQGVCDEGELCVPCQSGGMPTGACFGQ